MEAIKPTQNDNESPHDYASANRAHFNQTARSYDDNPTTVERARRTANSVLKLVKFDEEHTTVLDFACGTGLVSRELAPYAKSIVGVDISRGMVDEYNRRVANQGIAPEEMQAHCLELKGDDSEELGGMKFDVVVCAAAYHHFPSIEEVTRTLVFFLKPGGALIVIDLLAPSVTDGTSENDHDHDHNHNHNHNHDRDHDHDHQFNGSDHSGHHLIPADVQHIVPHRNGFTEEAISTVFHGAGLGEFHFISAFHGKAHGRDATLFVAKGIKPP